MARASVFAATIAIAASLAWAGPSIQQVGKRATIDWTNNVYIASGEGAIPGPKEEPNRARAYLKAKGYARAAAIANLLMAVKGTAITYQATGKDYMADERVSQKIEGYVNNVMVTSVSKQEFEGHTIVVVEVRSPMYGEDTPGAVFLGTPPEDVGIRPGGEVRVIPRPTKAAGAPSPASMTPARASTPDKPYTSVIIDCTGCKIDRCMSPKIRRSDGSEVWGTVKADYDYVQDHGIVVYATSLAEARNNSRCGSNPLVMHAIGRAGGKFYSDPVISNEDAELLLAENAKSGFLDRFCVIFVKDGAL